MLEVYDIDPTPTPAFIPQLRSEVTSVVKTVHYGGCMDDTYLFTLPSGREAAKLNIRLTTLNELNGVVYEVLNATTAYHRSFPSSVPPMTYQEKARMSFLLTQPIHYDVNYEGICGGTCRHICWLLDKAHNLDCDCREPLGVVGGSPSSGTAPKWKCLVSLGMTWICPVIDDFLHEIALERDWVLDDRSAHLWSREEDIRMDAERRAEVDTLQKLLGVAVAEITILLAFCIRWM
ncbi:hypothetical protein Cgig2_012255 [Carnegiea gigantea]|uniref:Uncharacterized protein n=1 Tax=Carnegiea gigantea TaxID=171969 RepID=A0A9Q1K5V8_9CARY|nr:hypothetical protein Cgig2_012255 [Carnegiea gigantea]